MNSLAAQNQVGSSRICSYQKQQQRRAGWRVQQCRLGLATATSVCLPVVERARAPSNKALGYGSKGERLVAGVVPLSNDKVKVLLIQSSSRNGWVLPKGGWELDEATASIAACREAWEEGGIICEVQKDLGTIADLRPTTALTKNAPKASYQFFEATVTEERANWPEKHKRTRAWYTFAQATQLLAQRPELLEALKRSSLRR